MINKNLISKIILIGFITLFLVGTVNANDNIISNITTFSDSYVTAGSPTVNFGTATVLYSSLSSGGYYSLYNFSLSSLPSNIIINSASLNIYAVFSSSYTIYDINSAWTEMGVTWNNKPSFGDIIVPEFSTTPNNIWINKDIKNEVQSWYNGTNPNYGIYITGIAQNGAFASRESSNIPYISINYTIIPIEYISGSISDSLIFKCQPTIIYANFTSYANIISVYALFDNNRPQPMVYGVPQQSHQEFIMTDGGTGHYSLTYANTNTTPNGNKHITFRVYNNIANQSFDSGLKLVVAPDACSGTSMTNYTVLDSGFPKNSTIDLLITRPDLNFATIMLNPFIQVMGYSFYVMMIIIICIIIWYGTQIIMAPIVGAIFMLLGFGSMSILPPEWIFPALFALLIAFAMIIYRLIKGYKGEE